MFWIINSFLCRLNFHAGFKMKMCCLCCILVFAQTAGCRLHLPAFVIHHPQTFRVENAMPRQLPTSALFYRSEPSPKKAPTPVERDDIEVKIETDEPIQDNEVWMTATRTLGSLFLHQEDATRDHNVSNETANDGSASFPFHESTLSAYLLNLKRQEEVNREKSSNQTKTEERKPEKKELSRGLSTDFQIDQKMAKELDDSVTRLALADSMLDDMEILPQSEHEMCNRKSPSTERSVSQQADILRLSHPEHYEKRIGRDMRHLAVSIAASIDKPWQWKLFFDEGGGVLPLLECIRDGARSVEKGKADFMDGDVEGTAILMEQHEASFAAACTACRALRDLSALSKDFSAVVTDDMLKVNEQWSTCVVEGKGYDCSSGGLVSDLLILLKHANEPTELFMAPKKGRRTSFYLSNKRRRRDARRRCGLYVVQLMLAMAIASDKAVATLRSTSGLIEEVVQCSSYAPSECFRRKWIRKPLNLLGRKIPGLKKSQPTHSNGWIPSGLRGKMQENANKLLAALGHNIWVPKQPGQRGLRILSLDGGGTRGIAAVTSIRHIVDAMGGIEVCDAFDMIVGTSTGAIVAFLVGLRRESAADARIRYDTLIKRIFVKSLLKPIMLATTTASYDEANLMEVLDEILKDDGMLDSRANPAVPLVTAVSSKMSSTPSQLCLLRNYNYGGGEMPDSFCIDPEKARKRLGLDDDDVVQAFSSSGIKKPWSIKCAPRTGIGSRYPGSFRVTQKIALRATTAAPTFFKPLLSFDELYVDGGIVASNPTAVAVHEARTVFPGVPLEVIVSVGTGVFTEIKVPPRVGWDGVVAQILDSATDAEQVHHVLQDVFGEGSTAQHSGTKMASTKYFRFNAVVGEPDSFPIDETDPRRLQELCDIVDNYMAEEEQQLKLKQLGEIINPPSRFARRLRG
eukprot:CCRYP_013828-RA/>CCRYP_013828-RA protein AED:0.12 eAED:0.12 QI:366/1/1/1/1/1/12/339/913